MLPIQHSQRNPHSKLYFDYASSKIITEQLDAFIYRKIKFLYTGECKEYLRSPLAKPAKSD